MRLTSKIKTELPPAHTGSAVKATNAAGNASAKAGKLDDQAPEDGLHLGRDQLQVVEVVEVEDLEVGALRPGVAPAILSTTSAGEPARPFAELLQVAADGGGPARHLGVVLDPTQTRALE